MSAAAAMAGVSVALGSSFGIMAIGLYIARTGWLSPDARKSLSMLYAKLVFPFMVFRGVAAINLLALDLSVALVVLVAKATLAALVTTYGARALRGRPDALANAAMLAMAASHSFDVTMGVPLAKVLYPGAEAYVYLNQSVQLVLVNPVLLVLMELGGGGGAAATAGTVAAARGGAARRAVRGVATNPLVVMTLAGLLAGQTYPEGLPAAVAALSAQVAAAGPFPGFLSLGFAIAGLGSISAAEMRHALVLGAAKLVLMPALYVVLARVLGCETSAPFLGFLGALPASASVYSLSLTTGLSPRVIGPLVPVTMLLCVALAVLPLWPPAAAWRAADALSAALGLAGAAALVAAAPAATSKVKRR